MIINRDEHTQCVFHGTLPYLARLLAFHIVILWLVLKLQLRSIEKNFIPMCSHRMQNLTIHPYNPSRENPIVCSSPHFQRNLGSIYRKLFWSYSFLRNTISLFTLSQLQEVTRVI
jgi:hypothetical protein